MTASSDAALLIDTLRLGGIPDPNLAVRWRRANPVRLLDLISREGAAIWLFRRLRVTGIGDALPAPLANAIRELALERAASRLEVEAEAVAVLSLLRRADIPVIAIKGMARCVLAGRYPYLDARATQDVDLLVEASRAAEADAELRADGYRPASGEGDRQAQRHHHLPALHKGRVTVELHDSTSTRVSPGEAWRRADQGSELLPWNDQQVRVAGPTDLAWSAIAHAMEDGVAGFRLKRYLELAALVSDDAPIDWNVVRQRAGTTEAFAVDDPVIDGAASIRRWIAAALTLVAQEKRPAWPDLREFSVVSLLGWRLAAMRTSRFVGPRFAARLEAEGERALIGMPIEASPAWASAWGRGRRRAAAGVARAAFHGWHPGH